MNEKSYFDEMKTLFKEEKKLVYGGLTVIAILVITLSAWLISKNHIDQQDGMSDLMTAYLEDADFAYLPEEQLDKVSETAVKILDEMVTVETDKGKMVQAVKEAVLKLNMGLSDSEADELASWLVNLYLDNYASVYGESEKINSSLLAGHNMLEQMEQDLLSMQEYLSKLDQSVQQNQQELTSLSTSQSSSYETVNEYLSKMENLITELQNEFSSYENSYEDGQNSSKTEISGIKTQLLDLQTDISETQKVLEDYIKNTDTNNSGRFEAVKEKVNNLQTSVQNGFSSMKDSLSVEIAALKKDNSTASTELAEDMESIYESITKELQISQDNLLTVLSKMESELAVRDSQLTQNVDEHVNELNVLLGSIHSNIGQSQKDIQNMLSEMTVQDTANMEGIMERFEQINTDVAGINAQMDDAHAELKTLIAALQKSEDENHAELLSRLGSMDSSFEQKNEENYQNLLNSLQTQTADFRTAFDSLNDTLETKVSTIQQNVADSKEEMLQRISVMENGLNTSVTNLTTNMTGNQEAVLQRISEMETGMSQNMAGIQNDLRSVFQSVSNGKALLASALLTKNVTIGEDATFKQIYDAIIAVPQEIVLGEAQIPGNIEYEYHYHTGDSVNGGGCYTVEEVHQHVGSCYVTCNYTNGGCVAQGNYQIDGYMHCPYEYKHSYCTSGSWVKGEYVHINDGKSHKAESSGTHLVVVCGKAEGTHYGWMTGCGLGDGQIIGAKITYVVTEDGTTEIGSESVADAA